MRANNVMQKSQEYFFYALIFLLPLQTRWMVRLGELNGGYFEYGTISLYFTDILVLWSLCLFVILAIFNRKFSIFNFQFSKIWITIGILELFIFISIFSAYDWQLALYGYGVFLLGIGLFFVATTLRYDPLKVYISLAAAGVVQSLLGLWQVAVQSVYGSKWLGMAAQQASDVGVSVVGSDSARWLRAYGSLPHPNMLGGFLALALVCSVILYVTAHHRRQRAGVAFGAAAMLLNSVGLVATFSRSGWLAAFVGLAILGVWTLARYHRQGAAVFAKALIVIALGASLAGGALYGQLHTRVMATDRLEVNSLTERARYQRDAWRIINNNWLFGVGIKNYGLALYEIDSERSVYEYEPVHNVFLLIWAEVGAVGFVCFLVLLFYCFFVAWQKKNFASMSLFAVLVVLIFFDHWLWSLHFGVLLFWGILGVVLLDSKKIV